MACPACGVEVGDTQRFCHQCGATLPGATQPIAGLPLLEPPQLDPPPAAGAEDTPLVILTDIADTIVAAPTTGAPAFAAAGFGAPTGSMTTELPAVFDGSGDLVEYPEPAPGFTLRVGLVMAVFAAIAVGLAAVADVVDIRTTRPAAGIATGVLTLDDLGTNLAAAAVAGVVVMVLGTLLSCFGLRWGAGLAGGAGLAVAGWASLSIGLAELPIAVAESITRASPEQFTLRVTRDVGWFLVVVAGLIGVAVFLTSLRSAGSDGRPALNPVVAAVTALATVVLAVGPLVPIGQADFADNFGSNDPSSALPAAFFAGRLVQVAVIALVGVIGMLLVRSYGLGLAAGSVSVAVVLWATSLAQAGEVPVGIADRNPGATNTEPHAVTSTGMVGTLTLLAVAAVFAAIRLRTRPHRPTPRARLRR